MGIDVFFCSIPYSAGSPRMAMRDKCLERWEHVPGANIRRIEPKSLECEDREFQRLRRIYADINADSHVYVVADDDCLLPDNFNLYRCLGIFQDSTFMMLSLLPSNANIVEWNPEGYVPHGTYDVMEHVSIGGIRFCRKWHLKSWPPMGESAGYDRIHADAIRAEDGRVGYFRHHSMEHLGEGCSSVWTLPEILTNV